MSQQPSNPSILRVFHPPNLPVPISHHPISPLTLPVQPNVLYNRGNLSASGYTLPQNNAIGSRITHNRLPSAMLSRPGLTTTAILPSEHNVSTSTVHLSHNLSIGQTGDNLSGQVTMLPQMGNRILQHGQPNNSQLNYATNRGNICDPARLSSQTLLQMNTLQPSAVVGPILQTNVHNDLFLRRNLRQTGIPMRENLPIRTGSLVSPMLQNTLPGNLPLGSSLGTDLPRNLLLYPTLGNTGISARENITRHIGSSINPTLQNNLSTSSLGSSYALASDFYSNRNLGHTGIYTRGHLTPQIGSSLHPMLQNRLPVNLHPSINAAAIHNIDNFNSQVPIAPLNSIFKRSPSNLSINDKDNAVGHETSLRAITDAYPAFETNQNDIYNENLDIKTHNIGSTTDYSSVHRHNFPPRQLDRPELSSDHELSSDGYKERRIYLNDDSNSGDYGFLETRDHGNSSPEDYTRGEYDSPPARASNIHDFGDDFSRSRKRKYSPKDSCGRQKRRSSDKSRDLGRERKDLSIFKDKRKDDTRNLGVKGERFPVPGTQREKEADFYAEGTEKRGRSRERRERASPSRDRRTIHSKRRSSQERDINCETREVGGKSHDGRLPFFGIGSPTYSGANEKDFYSGKRFIGAIDVDDVKEAQDSSPIGRGGRRGDRRSLQGGPTDFHPKELSPVDSDEAYSRTYNRRKATGKRDLEDKRDFGTLGLSVERDSTHSSKSRERHAAVRSGDFGERDVRVYKEGKRRQDKGSSRHRSPEKERSSRNRSLKTKDSLIDCAKGTGKRRSKTNRDRSPKRANSSQSDVRDTKRKWQGGNSSTREGGGRDRLSYSDTERGSRHSWGNKHGYKKFASQDGGNSSGVRSEGSDDRKSCSSRSKGNTQRHESHTSNSADRFKSRSLSCYCLPEANILRTMTYQKSGKYYTTPESASSKSTSVATADVEKLHKEFEEKIIQEISHVSPTDTGVPLDVSDNTKEDSEYVTELLYEKLDTLHEDIDADSDESSDESAIDLDGYTTLDEDDGCDDGGDDGEDDGGDHDHNNTEPITHSNKRTCSNGLHPELWFNVKGEVNNGKECKCNTKNKNKWIVHNIYPDEKAPEACEALGNNGLKLYHYWITMNPQTNFMTERPSRIEYDGKTYTFEGFSLLTHTALDAIPRCTLMRFNIKYEIIFIQEPIPNNFCIKDLDLFSKFLFYDVLELYDWDVNNENTDGHCNLFHFLPRFTRKIGVSEDGCEQHELLSMTEVLKHLVKSWQPLLQDVDSDDNKTWRDFTDSCVNNVVTNTSLRPKSLRIDEVKLNRLNEKEDTIIVHHGIRPVQLSFSGDLKCQKLLKAYLKLRNSITNRPDASPRERLKLLKMKLTLDNMKMKDSLRRDCCVEVSASGMIKTGLNSDITQHALLLPVLVHHIRYHLSLQSLDAKIGYEFKNRALLQLAFTHPSYVLNYGTNPDHARNTLSNCGVKKPRYGDKRNTYKYVKKKGIVHLINIMAKLEDLEGSQSFIQHNERLEFLGDAVLEFICTAHLFFLFPEMNEGSLVTHRSSLVQNKHLATIAKKLELDSFMRFSHGPDLCHEEDMEHAMANCFEALLGAIYLDSDLPTVRKVFCDHAFEETELRGLWSDLHHHPLQAQQPKGDRHFISCSDILKKLVKLEENIGFQFDHIRLLARAFTHPQVGFNNLTFGNNQRMEFLGDAIVQWITADHLYRYFPEHHEGHLTLLRSSLVNRNTQAQIAGEIGLNQYVNFGVGQIIPKLRQKHLADLFEAFLAAIFIDKGLEPVEVFCKVCLFPRLQEVIIKQEWLDAKSQLQCCCIPQAKHPDKLPAYKVLRDFGSPGMKHFTVGVYFNGKRLGTGDGENIREAEMKAAQHALKSNYFPELARQKKVLHAKHKNLK